jgi:hypothetical protein
MHKLCQISVQKFEFSVIIATLLMRFIAVIVYTIVILNKLYNNSFDIPLLFLFIQIL